MGPAAVCFACAIILTNTKYGRARASVTAEVDTGIAVAINAIAGGNPGLVREARNGGGRHGKRGRDSRAGFTVPDSMMHWRSNEERSGGRNVVSRV